MDTISPTGTLIGFDATSHPGRRATDRPRPDASFAEVYDLAAYSTTGSRAASRVDSPLATVRPIDAGPAPVAGPASTLSAGLDGIAAERLYLHMTQPASWSRSTGDEDRTTVLRLHDSTGRAVREVRVTELGTGDDDGPQVA